MRLRSSDTLRALMQQKGVSYQDMALAAGCSKGFVSHLAKERKTTCTPAVADRIARRLDVPLDLLFVASPSISKGQDGHHSRKRAAA
jgi:transcriptional regulator with XRE-family HTH domain